MQGRANPDNWTHNWTFSTSAAKPEPAALSATHSPLSCKLGITFVPKPLHRHLQSGRVAGASSQFEGEVLVRNTDAGFTRTLL